MNEEDPQPQYQQEVENQTKLLRQLERRRTILGWLRLAVFVFAALLAYNVFSSWGLVGLVPTAAGAATLLYLIVQDLANNTKRENTKALIAINEQELSALDHRFLHREEGGRFLPAEHAYAADLDIFGKASVYQWLNRSYTEQGQNLLAQNLLQAQATAGVLQRQEAVKELAPQLKWRQQFQAFAMQTTITQDTEDRVYHWAAEEDNHFRHPVWKLVVTAYSLLTLASVCATLLGYISVSVFSGLFLLYSLVSATLSRNAVKAYARLNGIAKEIATLQTLVAWLERPVFHSAHLKALQESLSKGPKPASEAIKSLNTILDRFDLRLGIMGLLFLNPFLLWDLRQMFALNGWRSRNRPHLPLWFGAVAEAELLHSMSTLRFNQPTWVFASFSSRHFTLQGRDIGHPLLPPKQRVANDFTLQNRPKIGLVTGSNMAGKSTFLRSLGVNIVLAQMGAPVCASLFNLSPVDLVSSMRIADNLAENTSTFYAELKKLRTIIKKVKAKEPAFILLDEILRGTNSFDRHKGSAAFIKQLIKEGAAAVIATHDVELAAMENFFPGAIENYHFDVQVGGEELYFDYKLKPGVCQSLNASLLMKKIGIEIED